MSTQQSYFEESALKANTENGKDWLRKALHPPGVKGTSYNGYPDKSVIPAIHQEYRLDWEKFLPTKDNPATMLLLHCPSFINPLFYAEYSQARTADPNGSDNSWLLGQSNDQISNASITGEMGKVQTAYLSETLQYDATGFNNSGMLYSAQFSPSTYTLALSTLLLKFHKQGHLDKHMPELERIYGPDIRSAYKTITQKTKSNSNNDFELISNDDFWNVGIPANITTQLVQVVQLGLPITQPTDISMLSPKKYTSRSTEGAFIVHQSNEDYNKWCAVRCGSFAKGVSPADRPLMLCLYETTNAAGISTITPFNVNKAYVTDIEWPNWTWAYTMFTGMQAGSAGGTAPMVNIKTIRGIAIAPTPRSILNPSCVAPALYDPQALQTYSVITQSRQDAMPASFNMGGSLLGGAGLVMPLMSKTISSISDAISGADGSKSEKKNISTELAEAKATETNESLGETNTTKKAETQMLPKRSRPRPRSRSRGRSSSRPRQVHYQKRAPSFNRRRTRSVSKYRSKSRRPSSRRPNTKRNIKVTVRRK